MSFKQSLANKSILINKKFINVQLKLVIFLQKKLPIGCWNINAKMMINVIVLLKSFIVIYCIDVKDINKKMKILLITFILKKTRRKS